jgi:hypothetical protein
MVLLDYPFVSDLLKETLVQNQFPVIATTEAMSLMIGHKVNWISSEAAIEKLQEEPLTPVYTNSENSISWIQQNLPDSPLLEKVKVFKNKFSFRELVKEMYPDYFFEKVHLSALSTMDVSNLTFPFIIKPVAGFFSIAVHKVDNASDWPEIVSKIQKQIQKSSGLYSNEVVNQTEFIIEEYIPGDEYAFDCFFDAKGKPVITNILHHHFASETDVSDRVYSSSEEIILRMKPAMMGFLEGIARKIALRNFPLHIEVRETEEGKIIPIEVNPMRFGGWCTTADLTWFAYGFNPYAYFFKSLEPDWESIFENRKNKIYSLILLDNQSDIPQEDIAYFDFDLAASDFERPLHVRKVNMDKYGVFGFLFTETSKRNEKELVDILHSDLEKYMVLKSTGAPAE